MTWTLATNVCVCTHAKGRHFVAKGKAESPCRDCSCLAFVQEPICRCGHGKKAHAKGPCHHKYLCGCTAFRERVA